MTKPTNDRFTVHGIQQKVKKAHHPAEDFVWWYVLDEATGKVVHQPGHGKANEARCRSYAKTLNDLNPSE